LRFERFLSEQVTCIYGHGWKGKIEKHVQEAAQVIHSLEVMNGFGDAISLPIQMSDRCRTSGGMQYLRYGAARRFHMMWYAYRNVVVYSANPRRRSPLSDGESGELTRDLNVIYFNMRGALDNLAWALLHECAPDKLKINRAKIGLFNSCIIQDVRFDQLSAALDAHRDWNRDLADRRDPSAHRIPLTIPPQVLKPEDAPAYAQLINDAMRAAGNLDFATPMKSSNRANESDSFVRISFTTLKTALSRFIRPYPKTLRTLSRFVEMSEIFSRETRCGAFGIRK
jgi:hypothetical protein